MNINYYNYIIPYEVFGKTPANGINCYSFALNPLNIQPSGTCNFTRINQFKIHFTLNSVFTSYANDEDIIIKLHAVNYNVLRISNGLCRLIY